MNPFSLNFWIVFESDGVMLILWRAWCGGFGGGLCVSVMGFLSALLFNFLAVLQGLPENLRLACDITLPLLIGVLVQKVLSIMLTFRWASGKNRAPHLWSEQKREIPKVYWWCWNRDIRNVWYLNGLVDNMERHSDGTHTKHRNSNCMFVFEIVISNMLKCRLMCEKVERHTDGTRKT